MTTEDDPTLDDASIAQTLADPGSVTPDSLDIIAGDAAPLRDERYQVGRMIGRGGMGEVVAAVDTQIGREVAIKRMHGDLSPAAVARFVREAQIQGRLEHPAIVPVHELSTDPDGRPFFVMKRLVGTTLAEILEALAAGDGKAIELFPRQRLLRAFAEVCLAVEFAHQRDVIHRDLKPANIVLGEFGEVYVLDWGVARIGGGGDDASASNITRIQDDLAATQAGVVLGTPGYMPREQVEGVPDLDRRADVFALGTILFEILAGEPLLAPNLTSALADYESRPSRRVPDRAVPPELEDACVAATSPAREHRLTSARELGERVQRYLDGDRDVEHRKTLAHFHLAEARTAFARLDDESSRRLAAQQAARALALDPTLAEAAALVSRMMLEPPKQTPQEVIDEVAALDRSELHRLNRTAMIASLSYLLFIPVMLWLGIRSGWYLVAAAGVMALNTSMVYLSLRRPESHLRVLVTLAMNGVLIGLLMRIATPYLVGPGLAAVSVMAFTFHPSLGRRPILWAVMAAGVVVPWLLELSAATATSTIAHGDLVIAMPAVTASSPQLQLGLLIYAVVVIAIGGALGRAVAIAQWEARCKLQLQAWHLRQIVATA